MYQLRFIIDVTKYIFIIIDIIDIFIIIDIDLKPDCKLSLNLSHNYYAWRW